MIEEAQSEILILGGGLAGAMAALRLSSAGRTTVLIEKEREAHHKVCGEFLSPEAVYYLRDAGIDPLGLGAVPIQDLSLSAGKRCAETRLPFTALSLSRHILDQALLARAAETGARILRGTPVQALTRDRDLWTAQLAGQTSLRSSVVFLATGKHDLRGWPRPQGVQSDLLGFKLHWRLTAQQTRRLQNRMELFLFRGGYGGLALVEQGIANLCLVVRKPLLRKLGAWPALLASLLAENPRLRAFLASAEPLWTRPLAVSSIPYGYLGSPYVPPLLAPRPFAFLPLAPCPLPLPLAPRPSPLVPAFWPIGDQIACIPSFTGDGMSIALHSAASATQAFLHGRDPSAYQAELVSELHRGMHLATALSRACVTPVARHLAPVALAILPQAMAWIASATRIPAHCLLTGPRLDAKPIHP